MDANESPRCAVVVESIVSGFEIAVEGEPLLLAKGGYHHIGFHSYQWRMRVGHRRDSIATHYHFLRMCLWDAVIHVTGRRVLQIRAGPNMRRTMSE